MCRRTLLSDKNAFPHLGQRTMVECDSLKPEERKADRGDDKKDVPPAVAGSALIDKTMIVHTSPSSHSSPPPPFSGSYIVSISL